MKLTKPQERMLRDVDEFETAGKPTHWRREDRLAVATRLEKAGLLEFGHVMEGTHKIVTRKITATGRQWLADHPLTARAP